MWLCDDDDDDDGDATQVPISGLRMLSFLFPGLPMPRSAELSATFMGHGRQA